MSEKTSFRATYWPDATPSGSDIVFSDKNIPEAIAVAVSGVVSIEDLNGNVMTRTLDVGDYGYRPKKILSATTATVKVLY